MRLFLVSLAVAGLVQATPVDRFRPSSDSHRLAPIHTPPPPPSPNFNVIDKYQADESLPFSAFRSELFALSSDERHDDYDSHVIKDSYIVRYKDHVEPHHHHAHKERVAGFHALDIASFADFEHGLVGFVHDFLLGDSTKAWGYSGRFSSKTLDLIRSQPEVAYVERDTKVYATETEKGAPWGLARLSHRKPLSFGTFNKYLYEAEGGEGVDVYVIDTGINIEHVELEGRAKWGKTIPQDEDKDSNGHGSHVAGTIASKKYGVAKKANVIAVKVLGAGGSGSMSDVMAGVSWAAEEAVKKANSSGHKGSVANMSLGGGKSQSLDDIVDAAVEQGLHFAVAAGNDNRDACTFSPAASENAITVGASTINDDRAYFSNHGKCVDVFGPGLNILSIWNTGNTSVNTISGTSMASPHLAGLAAYYLSLYPHTFTPSAEDYAAAGVAQPSISAASMIGFMEERVRIPSIMGLGRGSQMIFDNLREWTSVVWPKKAKELSHPPTLDPKVLKASIIRLASRGLLDDLPSGTPNYLAFNNYTLSK